MNFVQQRGHEILKRLPPGKVVGAEVGVWDGRLSSYLLTTRSDLVLYMVDRWEDVPDTHRYRQSNSQMAQTSAEGFRAVYAKAMRVADAFKLRAVPLQGESVKMAASVQDGSLDFVFVDADHSYEGVKEDITAWKSKLKPGGLMCGHDWEHPDHPEEWGVRQAAEEYAAEVGGKIEVGKNRTWFLVRS